MKKILRWLAVSLAMVLLSVVNSCRAEEPLRNMPPDSWGGRHAHLGYSAVMGFVGSEVLPNRAAAWGACFGVGVWKEWKDWRHAEPGYRHGLFSRHDLQMDALGCTLGVVGNWGLHFAAGPAGGARISYSWEFK